MNSLIVVDQKGKLFVDSREVATSVRKRHDHLLRDIEKYIAVLKKSNEPKIGSVEFFVKSQYVDSKGETRLCYLCTKKGCDMIAHKLTGDKGILFTAQYIDKFYQMEFELQKRQIAKLDRKPIRRELTDVIQDDPNHSKWDFKLYTDLAYKTVLGRNAAQIRKDRGAGKKSVASDYMTSDEIKAIAKLESQMSALKELGMDYQQIKMLLLNRQMVGNIAS